VPGTATGWEEAIPSSVSSPQTDCHFGKWHNNLAAIANGLAEIRNLYGTGHGKPANVCCTRKSRRCLRASGSEGFSRCMSQPVWRHSFTSSGRPNPVTAPTKRDAVRDDNKKCPAEGRLGVAQSPSSLRRDSAFDAPAPEKIHAGVSPKCGARAWRIIRRARCSRLLTAGRLRSSR